MSRFTHFTINSTSNRMKWRTRHHRSNAQIKWMNRCVSFYMQEPRFPFSAVLQRESIICIWRTWTHGGKKPSPDLWIEIYLWGDWENVSVCVEHILNDMQNDLTEQFAFNRSLLLNLACECCIFVFMFIVRVLSTISRTNKKQTQEIQRVCDKYQFIVLAEFC